jgi:preprotein translocase subunit SecA
MREFERRVVLSVLDRKWREHLYEMDYLREGIGLRGWAQRDPLVEYQREGFDMFNTMMDGIKEESVGSLFNMQVQVQQDPIVAEGDEGDAGPAAISTLAAGAAAAPQAAPARPARPQAGGAGDGTAQPERPRRPARPRAAAVPAQGDAAVPAALASPALARPRRTGQLNYTAPSEDATGTSEQRTTAPGDTDFSRVGRNSPCPCGSGKKFKQCHGDPRNR